MTRLFRWFGRAQRPISWGIVVLGFVSLGLVISNVIATGDAKLATILGAVLVILEGFQAVQDVENELGSEGSAED